MMPCRYAATLMADIFALLPLISSCHMSAAYCAYAMMFAYFARCLFSRLMMSQMLIDTPAIRLRYSRLRPHVVTLLLLMPDDYAYTD